MSLKQCLCIHDILIILYFEGIVAYDVDLVGANEHFAGKNRFAAADF